jgi:RNA polymerase sigma-70 factor (ECF subfamily)
MNQPSPTGNFTCVLTAWQAHESALRGYLMHQLGDAYLSDDVLQETLLKAMRQGEHFCLIEQPRAWLFQVARNLLVDRARLQKPEIEVSDALHVQIDERAPVEALDACLIRNLAEISAEDREIIEQCDLHGIKQQAYADTHGLTLTAVKSRLLRARQRLRDTLVRNCQVRFDDTGQVCCHVPRDTPSH